MKRDMDLVRNLLFRIEDADLNMRPDFDIDDRSESEIFHHLDLMIEAGLIKGSVIPAVGDPALGEPTFVPMIQRLTWEGHEFLDAVRAESTWNEIKRVTKDNRLQLPIEILKNLAIKALNNNLLP